LTNKDTATEDTTAGEALAGAGLDVRIAQELIEQARAQGVSLVGPGGLLSQVTRTVLQTALEAEMTDHLGYAKGDPAGRGRGNHRNGSSPKTVQTEVDTSGRSRTGDPYWNPAINTNTSAAATASRHAAPGRQAGEPRARSSQPPSASRSTSPPTATRRPPGGAKPYTITYEQPENCSTDDGGEAAGDGSAVGGAAAGSGDGGGLPVTGAAAGAVAGIAAVLLTIGVVLFAVARRRQVKFTA
jgi:hypothetical protein